MNMFVACRPSPAAISTWRFGWRSVFNGAGCRWRSLIQAANLGLLAACERVDERRGLRFSNYAAYWIQEAILREIDNSATVIRIPVHVRAAGGSSRNSPHAGTRKRAAVHPLMSSPSRWD